MSEALAMVNDETLLAMVSSGDCSKLTAEQKIAYYRARCDAAGLDPRSQPFEFVSLQGKLKLYATKAATDQLSAIHGVRASITGRETVGDVHVVTVRAEARDGRQTEDVGAISVKGLGGEALANAMMKTVTKAKRRAILSLCGLGMTDETEVEAIPGAQRQPATVRTLRGTVPDDPPPAQLSAKADDPPHDPATGETIDAGQVKLYDDLLLACADGFNAQAHKENWLAKHAAEIKALPQFARKEIKAAYEAASTNVPEKKS